MKNRPDDVLKRSWFLVADAASAFQRNNDLLAASSLAFSAMLALIPALFLLTVLIGIFIGSSAQGVQQTRELMTQLIPAYSQVILHEVDLIWRHRSAIGALNLLVLFWSITPLVADMRVSLGTVFRRRSRPFLLEKLLDAALSAFLLLGLTAIAAAGVVFTVMEEMRQFRLIPAYLEEMTFFTAVTAAVFVMYFIFSKRAKFLHLLAGALVTSLLWFALRPAFHVFLTYNPGYGFAFGSFKSLLVVIIWIYISLALFLFGAEVTASLGRGDTGYIKNLMEGGKNVPSGIVSRYVVRHAQGSIVFQDGDPGDRMFSVLKGKVSVQKGGREIGLIPPGGTFGGLSFLLASRRAATAIAVEDTELVALDNENVRSLMNEFPEFVVAMFRDMALRLREASKMID